MPRFGFRGFATASTVALTVSQAAASAGATVASWGELASNASLSIDVWDDADGSQTGAYACPSSIHLEARPTGFAAGEIVLPPTSLAATPASSSDANVYDPAFHEIHYFWTVTRPAGSSATFSNEPNIPDIWNNRNAAYGKKVAFVMDVPGDYTFVCFAVDETAARAVASVTRTAVDADTVYPGNLTLCVNPAGDTDFSWAPDGASTYATGADDLAVLDAALNVFRAGSADGGTSRRLLFKPGATYVLVRAGAPIISIASFDSFRRLFIGTGGTTPAVINVLANRFFEASFRSRLYSITLDNLDLRGDWKPDYEVGASLGSSVNVSASTHWTLHRVSADGFTTCFSVDTSIHSWAALEANRSGMPILPARICWSECSAMNWSSFGLYVGLAGNKPLDGIDYSAGGRAKGAHIATKFVQSPTAINVQPNNGPAGGGGGRSVHNDSGPIRINYLDDWYFGCCDHFSNNGIGGHQSPFRVNNGMFYRAEDRMGWSYYNVDRCAMEGGGGILGLSNGSPDFDQGTRNPCNAVFDKVLLVGTPWTNRVGIVSSGAVTLRNITSVIPDQPQAQGNAMSVIWTLNNSGSTESTHCMAQKWRGYNNTVIFLRSISNNHGGTTVPMFDANELAAMADHAYENSILHVPNLAPSVEGGVTGTTIAGWNPRYKGRNDNWRRYDFTLAADVPVGGTFQIPYSSIPATTLEGRAGVDVPTTNAGWQAYFTNNPTHNFHYIFLADNSLRRTELTFVPGTTGFTVTNNSGATIAAQTVRVFIDRRGLHPGPNPATVTPNDLPVLWTPVANSPAIVAQDQGTLAIDDFLLQERSPPRTRGAVEVAG